MSEDDKSFLKNVGGTIIFGIMAFATSFIIGMAIYIIVGIAYVGMTKGAKVPIWILWVFVSIISNGITGYFATQYLDK